MGTWSGRTVAALALAVSMVAGGCGGGGSDAPAFPENTIQLNGVRMPTEAPAEVLYYLDQRFVRIYGTDGGFVELEFEGQDHELPMGHFVGTSPGFVAASVCPAGGPQCRMYLAPDEVGGDLSAGGDEAGGFLDVAGGLALDNGTTVDEVLFSYSGAYDYLAD